MQNQLHTLGQESVHQLRDTLRRVTALHEAHRVAPGPHPGHVVEVPKPDAVAWEDTELDLRRVVL